MGARLSSSAYRPPRRERAPRPRAADLSERIPLALAAVEEVVRLRGRPPGVEEITVEAMDELAHARVSLQRAIDYCLDEVVGPQELESAAAAMREDLLVHYALGRLNRSETSDRPSAAMVRDIRTHFGSQRNAQDEATQYLMSLARSELIEGAIAFAAGAGLGAQDQKKRLIVQAQRIAELPGILRLYLACAAYLAGDPEDDWLVRIEPARKKVSYFPLEDADAPLPRTGEPILIDLARQTVAVTRTRRLLLSKSVVMGEGGEQQRHAEAEFRENEGLAEPLVLIRLSDI
jgi:DNA phosphorothioation-associated putative methyltransferase